MKVIKVDTLMNVTIEEPSVPGYKGLQKLIGGSIEHVNPRRLPHPFCMIVDEEGLLKGLPLNPFGSTLYETDKHGQPIVGDILLMKEAWTSDGYDIVGLTDEDIESLRSTFPLLKEA